MKYAVIQRPSPATLNILSRRMSDPAILERLKAGDAEAIGICQGTVLEVLAASDAAEKSAGVAAGELHGSCPQHLTCLAIVGDTAGVHAALEAVCKVVEQLG